MLKTKPFWLSPFVGNLVWVTIYPNIYYPEGINPNLEPEIIAHENVHLKQQNDYGKWRWLWRYLTSKSFRLDQEAKAIAVEILHRQADMRDQYISWYANMLAGKNYHKAAKSPAIARLAIEKEIAILDLLSF
jgi:hypothetical protein